MELITFKTMPGFFEMERDGEKPFTVRRIGQNDQRFRSLFLGEATTIQIVNTETGESFLRELTSFTRLSPHAPDWVAIHWKSQGY